MFSNQVNQNSVCLMRNDDLNHDMAILKKFTN